MGPQGAALLVEIADGGSTSFDGGVLVVTGPPGPQGIAGQSVVGNSEPPGGPCIAGGIRYVSATGTHFVCNGAVGPQGSTGPQGPPPLVSADGGIAGDGSGAAPLAIALGGITAEHIAPGAIVRGKLARESVLPENRGRGNSVRSFAVEFGGPIVGSPVAVFTVPAGKTFIVTDVVAFSPTSNNPGHIPYVIIRNGSTPRGYFPVLLTGQPGPGKINFEAGVRFDSGETVTLEPGSTNIFVTIAGYEF